jgi:DNA repair protein RadA/Sms
MGKCPECGEWNTLTEEPVIEESRHRFSEGKGAKPLAPIPLSQITNAEQSRIPTGSGEFDRVLGGGLVQGSAILLGGDPGIGKSTLALQLAHGMPSVPTLYVSGEESPQQLKLRADRLNVRADHIQVLPETNLTAIERAMKHPLIIIDSIQSLFWDQMPSAPGSVGQVRECAARLIRLAKERNLTLLIIGHVTKEGSIAGPKVLEHMVDTVLYFEGDRHKQFRIIRAFKNRFGSTNEIGIFEMRDTGLMEVLNPSEIFLQDRATETPGSVVVAAMEGTRPLLVEIQALVTPASGFGAPRRTVSGLDYNRLAIILAILEKKARLPLSQQDVFCNVVGGVEIDEPAADLGIALAILSSLKNKAIPLTTAVFGELGLGGELRPVSFTENRLMEIQKLGFKYVILPKGKLIRKQFSGLTLQEVERIWEEIL